MAQALANVPEDPDKHRSPVYKRRVSAKVRAALTERVQNMKTWAECARAAGLSEAAVYKAIKQPHVAALLEDMKAQYIRDIEALRAPFKAKAFEVGHELMTSAKSEAVKARMVEFFAGEAKQNSVNVNVNTQINMGGDYDFVRPGERLVDITPAPDSPSSDEGEESPDK